MALTAALEIPASAAAMTAALEGLVRLNEWVLTRQPLPPLYRSGVRYVREHKRPRRGAPEQWLRIDQLYRRGRGDCEDLTAARAAELRAAGVQADPYVIRTGPRRFHALVVFPDGSTEDPSKRLGM